MEMEIELGIAGVEAQPVVHDGTPANMLKSKKIASLPTSQKVLARMSSVSRTSRIGA